MGYPKEKILGLLKEWGVNKKIYQVFEAKLKGKIGKFKNEFNNLVDYKSLAHYTKKPNFLVISKNYVIIGKGKDRNDNAILIGVTEEGKIFVNWESKAYTKYILDKALRVSHKYEEYKTEFQKIDGEIEVYKTTDNVVRALLGYEKEIDDEEVLSENVSYRVQGDLLLSFMSYNTIIEEISRLLDGQVHEWLEMVILRRIRRVLENHGFTSEIQQNELGYWQVYVWGIPNKWDRDRVYRVESGIAKLLVDELYFDDIIPIKYKKVEGLTTTFYNEYPLYVYVSYYSRERDEVTKDNYPDIELKVWAGDPTRDIPYRPLIIRATISKRVVIEWVYRILRESEEQIKALEGRYKVIRGRHVIEYYGYPTHFSIVYRPKIIENSLEDDSVIFTVDVGVIYTTKPYIKLIHPEHGEKRIKLAADKCRVRIDSVATLESIDEEIIAKRNSYLFSEIAKQKKGLAK